MATDQRETNTEWANEELQNFHLLCALYRNSLSQLVPDVSSYIGISQDICALYTTPRNALLCFTRGWAWILGSS
jgi:hypothetical protein